MPKLLQFLALAAALAASHAFSPSPRTVSRRDAVADTAAAIVAASLPGAALAIEPCPPGSKNCLRQTWTPPAGTSAADAAAQLRAALAEYPQGGLEDGKVDGGGYAVVADTLDGGKGGAAAVEYRSSGKGTFAKLFNGGRPFVDDLAIEAAGGKFEFRSASRQGESDFGVNGKRLEYLGGLLKAKGWSGIDL